MSILGLPRGAAALSNVVGLVGQKRARVPAWTAVRGSSRNEAREGLLVRGRWIVERVALLAGPVLAVCFFVRATWQHDLAFDFVHAYLHGARDVWAGRSPYHHADVEPGIAFLYPPLTAYAVTPFLLLPRLATQIVVSLLGAAACFGALWASGVRDRLCYVLAFGSPVMFFSIQAGNLSAAVTLGAALAWRYRDRKLTPVGVGILIALKLSPWPLLLFYIATRRVRAAAVAGASALVAIFLPWAAIGFAGLGSYPGMLSARTHVQEGISYTVGALVANFAPWSVAHAVTYVLAALVVIWMLRGRSEAQVFSAALGLTILLSPLALYDYFGLIFVVLGIMKRVRGWQWSAPLLLWIAPAIGRPSLWQLALVLVVIGSVMVSATGAAEPAAEAGADGLLRRVLRRPNLASPGEVAVAASSS